MPSNKPSAAVRIADLPAAPKSRMRQQFNTLIKKLEKERTLLAAWQETLPLLHTITEQELAPLGAALRAHDRRMVLLCDQAYGHKSMGARNKETLAEYIRTTGWDLLQFGDDEELDRIVGKYDDSPFGPPDAQDGADLKTEMENLFGVELEDGGSDEAVMAALHAKMDELERQAEARWRQAEEKQRQAEERRAQSPGAIKQARRKEAEEALMKQSVREIYRKLASALHPDRETDPAERSRKTGLMQRVNVAYQKNDLLGLLELQLEIEQIDQAAIDGLSDERIGQFNAVLRAQVRELEGDNMHIETTVAMEWELPLYRRLTPEAALRGVRDEVAQTRARLAGAARELEDLQDIRKLKAWLKDYRDQQYDEDWF
ncbi:J domain-containing protein [Duganella violaceipulchra]|uniref:J domain-containing protein n=1 Tax=Duganella violaceipulchra TaxID=2849652 RepID=A0AA41HDA0_9BURK|nr:J domain-containing protein [Duganella violaceicalia]MBV6325229.1 J domain-containing protein [Duganella violaceicalia]MCP2012443.1 hypothetical protein [Duganella violaceicalia]